MPHTCYNYSKEKPMGRIGPFCGYDDTGARTNFPWC